jgi:hypothetical protein
MDAATERSKRHRRQLGVRRRWRYLVRLLAVVHLGIFALKKSSDSQHPQSSFPSDELTASAPSSLIRELAPLLIVLTYVKFRNLSEAGCKKPLD